MKDKEHLKVEDFKLWMRNFPFIRTYFRESLRPHLWELEKSNLDIGWKKAISGNLKKIGSISELI